MPCPLPPCPLYSLLSLKPCGFPWSPTNREFTRALGRVLKRPTLLPLFAPMVRLIFGEMGQALLLEGQRVLPARLLEMEFPYLFPALEDALRDELGLHAAPRQV